MIKGHPKGLLAAALSNMGERFGYYIMNAVLALFLCSKFGLSEEKGTLIYSFFYAGIYVLSLVGGWIADRTQNYKGTIMAGLITMAAGYAVLSIPIMSTEGNIVWLLPLTCLALFVIAFGNGLFKGNLQAIVGQMYDNFEAEAAKKGEEALKQAKSKRDSGFQIFYVFINIGGVLAPFIAPLLRSWWLKAHDLAYNAQLPALCHEYIDNNGLTGDKLQNLNELATQVTNGAGVAADQLGDFCANYLDVFNTGFHYAFGAAIVAMLLLTLTMREAMIMYNSRGLTGHKELFETLYHPFDTLFCRIIQLHPAHCRILSVIHLAVNYRIGIVFYIRVRGYYILQNFICFTVRKLWLQISSIQTPDRLPKLL